MHGQAGRLASNLADCRIIVIGSASSEALLELRENGPDVIAVEATHASSAHEAAGDVTPCNLDDWQATVDLVAHLRDGRPTVIVLANIIAQLSNPLPALSAIRSLLAMNPDSRLVLSTPASQVGASKAGELPRDEAHVREWTRDGICDLLVSSGLVIERFGRAREPGTDDCTSVVVAAYDADRYERQLAQLGITTGTATKQLLLTTELSGVGRAGGIGTHVATQLARDEHGLVLHCEAEGAALPDRVVDLDALSTEAEANKLPRDDRILEVVSRLLFLLPGVESVEFQEHDGIGLRICTAKRVGLLPDTFKTVTHCHGNQHYLENGLRRWLRARVPFGSVRERLSVELADVVVFPSDHLRRFYGRMGLQLPAASGVQRPCYSMQARGTSGSRPIDTIAFIGKFSAMKGYDLFVDAFDSDFIDALRHRGIARVVLIAPGKPNASASKRISQHFDLVQHQNFQQPDVCRFVRENAGRALFTAPYRADNFPLAIYDVVLNGGEILAARAGGIPEIFPTPDWDACLFDVTVDDFRRAVLRHLDRTPAEREDIHASLIQSYGDADRSYGAYRGWSVPARATTQRPTATVMIPFFNTEPKYFEELIFGINQQIELPSEVIIVDDGSDEFHAAQIRRIAGQLVVPFRIIRHEANKGLAAARNTALEACTTEILINLDSDDVPLREFISNITRAFARDPGIAVAAGYLHAFQEDLPFQRALFENSYDFRPVGAGFIAGHKQNLLAHANSGVRVDVARRLGGWDATSRAKYEDWGFYLKVLGRGERIAIIPKIDSLYRRRRNSMLTNYDDWEGIARISIAQDALPRFEGIELLRELRDVDDMRHQLARREVRVAVSLSSVVRRNRLVRAVWQRFCDAKARLRRTNRLLTAAPR